jgi:hypothetical protein
VGLLNNVDYKNVLFTRSDGVNVTVKVNLNNPSDLNEDFLVLNVENINSPIESDLFYWINKKRFTLNEFKYFALNNNLCMKVIDKADTVLASFGSCDTVTRVFNHVFGINFN